MPLDPDELRLFYKLYPSLLCFVNQRQGITSTPFTTPEHFGRLPIEERLKLRDALVANIDLIDAFVSENPFKLSEDELEIVRSWKDLVAGEFYVYRCLKKYTVFLTTEEPVVAYGVLSLMDPFEDLIGPPAPASVQDGPPAVQGTDRLRRACLRATTSRSEAGFAGGSRSPTTTPRSGRGSSRPSRPPP